MEEQSDSLPRLNRLYYVGIDKGPLREAQVTTTCRGSRQRPQPSRRSPGAPGPSSRRGTPGSPQALLRTEELPFTLLAKPPPSTQFPLCACPAGTDRPEAEPRQWEKRMNTRIFQAHFIAVDGIITAGARLARG